MYIRRYISRAETGELEAAACPTCGTQLRFEKPERGRCPQCETGFKVVTGRHGLFLSVTIRR